MKGSRMDDDHRGFVTMEGKSDALPLRPGQPPITSCIWVREEWHDTEGEKASVDMITVVHP